MPITYATWKRETSAIEFNECLVKPYFMELRFPCALRRVYMKIWKWQMPHGKLNTCYRKTRKLNLFHSVGSKIPRNYWRDGISKNIWMYKQRKRKGYDSKNQLHPRNILHITTSSLAEIFSSCYYTLEDSSCMFLCTFPKATWHYNCVFISRFTTFVDTCSYPQHTSCCKHNLSNGMHHQSACIPIILKATNNASMLLNHNTYNHNCYFV